MLNQMPPTLHQYLARAVAMMACAVGMAAAKTRTASVQSSHHPVSATSSARMKSTAAKPVQESAGQARLAPAHIKSALAQVESGASRDGPCLADHMRGRYREVSRYQILPAVWRSYTARQDYSNPTSSWHVARRILADRARWFHSETRREPTAFDLYVIWHAPGRYRAAGFSPTRVASIIADRGRRFANLIESARPQGDSRASRSTAVPPDRSLVGLTR